MDGLDNQPLEHDPDTYICKAKKEGNIILRCFTVSVSYYMSSGFLHDWYFTISLLKYRGSPSFSVLKENIYVSHLRKRGAGISWVEKQ